jgi:hypothetical protein
MVWNLRTDSAEISVVNSKRTATKKNLIVTLMLLASPLRRKKVRLARNQQIRRLF